MVSYIVIDQNENWYICDFGNATVIPKTIPHTLLTEGGTEDYHAPELFVDEEETSYTTKIDIWSLGVSIYEAILHQRPFNNSKWVTRIPFSKWPEVEIIPKEYIPFLTHSLVINPNDRYWATQLLTLLPNTY